MEGGGHFQVWFQANRKPGPSRAPYYIPIIQSSRYSRHTRKTMESASAWQPDSMATDGISLSVGWFEGKDVGADRKQVK